MKTKNFIALALCAFFGLVNAQTKTTKPESAFEVSINGKIYKVIEGQPLNIEGDLKSPTIKVTSLPYRLIETAGMKIQYPAEMNFAYEQSENLDNWTLNGNDVVVMIFEFDGDVSVDDIINETRKKFGNKNCKLSESNGELGGKRFKVKSLQVKIAEQILMMDYYIIEAGNGKTRFICIQDLFNNGQHSDEFARVFSMIGNAIVFK